MSLDNVVSCRIHPAIGVARVGNSKSEYFLGPEVPRQKLDPPGGFKDSSGAVKRQAARFRVYGFDAAGKVVQELTASDADITWTAHLGNKKAAWYQFNNALDIPEAALKNLRRNPKVADRKSLVIDPGPRSITGLNKSGAAYKFNTGKFLGVTVPLGELRTDADGNLLVLGGLGAASTPKPNNPVVELNNSGWYDDISDGPVTARVVFKNSGGRTLQAAPAWILVGPPNYAPNLTTLVTLYDVAYEVALRKKWLQLPATPSFTRHIYPIFERLSTMQWVNEGFLQSHGWETVNDFLNPAVIARLNNKSAAQLAFRQKVFKSFRNPKYSRREKDAVPSLFGDGIDIPNTSPRYWFAITKTQYGFLQKWADGDFNDDWASAGAEPILALRDYPLERQPNLLNQAALEGCCGGPFHPGIEATWTLRQSSMYSGPFRLKHKSAANVPPDDYGPILTPAMAMASTGPLSASGPGDVTRWMALPWQTDSASCGARLVDPYLPSWWPARVPNHILTSQSYDRIMNPALSSSQRLNSFKTRENWLRHLKLPWQERIRDMISKWSLVGIIVRRPGPQDDGAPALPGQLFVESETNLLGSAMMRSSAPVRAASLRVGSAAPASDPPEDLEADSSAIPDIEDVHPQFS
jgi:hypothetical protein